MGQREESAGASSEERISSDEVPVEPGGDGSATDRAAADGVAVGDGVVAEVESLRYELESLNEQHLRLAAEFDNYRKRNQRERQALASRLQADLIASLLEVLDDLQRVAASEPESDTASVLEGVRLVEKKFVAVLESSGLEPLNAEGERFDPEVMEALMMVPTDDPEKDGHVADVFQRGYRLGDALVRPARVRVWRHEDADE